MKTLNLSRPLYLSHRLQPFMRPAVFIPHQIHHRIAHSVPSLRATTPHSLTEGSKIVFDQDGFRFKERVGQGQILFQFPSELAISGSDADSDPQLGPLVEGKGELLKLTLWLMNERSKGEQSNWYSFLRMLPEHSMSPILWKDEELELYLKGSPVLEQAKLRREALKQEWNSLANARSAQSSSFDLKRFSEETFLNAFSVVLGSAFYLTSIETFALLPPIHGVKRSGKTDACTIDYDSEADMVILSSQQPQNPGNEVSLLDDRPNGERLLTTGMVEKDNPSDYMILDFELVAADRLFTSKRQILESFGFQIKESFPIYRERIPVQLLSYLRLSRIQDPGQLAQVSFEEDREISQLNEYEVLQLVLGECRIRLSNYQDNWESDVSALQQSGLSLKEQLSRTLLLSEKQILQSCVDIVRGRLAPIRGIPAKSGSLEDPNQDITDMFKAIEEIPLAPKKAFDGFISWAKGDFDPEWNKKKKKRSN